MVAPIPLKYKEDWPKARERLLAYWEHHDIVDRVCIGVTAPQKEQTLLPESPDIVEQQVGLDLHVERLNVAFSNTYFGGEALPVSGSHLGYAVFGGEPSFGRGESGYGITDWVWVDPVIEDWEQSPYRFDRNSKWTQRFLDVTRAEYNDSVGKCFTVLGAILSPTDVLSLLRGSGNLCIDLIDRPDTVHEALSELLAAYKWLQSWYFELTNAMSNGSIVMGMWAPGCNCSPTCDFSCEISVKHYQEFVMPEIEEIARWSDHSFYHLDGADALRHLPALLELKELDGVQFARGAVEAGKSVMRWTHVYKQIQNAGKLQHISVEYDEVEPLVKELGPKGIFIDTTAPSIEAADDLLKNAEKWSCGKVYPVS